MSAMRNEEESSALFQLVYDELRRVAGRHIAKERPDHTLEATALVHEVWLRVADRLGEGKETEEEVLSYASRVMRSLLIDHARKKNSAKRGGAQARITLRESLDSSRNREVDVLELNDAVERLAEIDPELERIAELHLFGGLTLEECSKVLGMALRTLERRWKVAGTWLKKELAD